MSPKMTCLKLELTASRGTHLALDVCPQRHVHLAGIDASGTQFEIALTGQEVASLIEVLKSRLPEVLS